MASQKRLIFELTKCIILILFLEGFQCQLHTTTLNTIVTESSILSTSQNPHNTDHTTPEGLSDVYSADPLAANGSSSVARNKTRLYLAGLFPLSVPGWIGDYALQSVSAIQMAIDDINDREDILPEYELILEYKDTKASIGVAMTGLFELLYTPPTKICLMGEMLSFITQELAEVTSHWKLLQMAHASSASELSDRNRYPYFFRTIASAARLNPVQLAIMRVFGWKKVATLHEAQEPHAGVSSNLHQLLEESSVSVLAAESFIADPKDAMKRLKDKDVRIIIGNFYEAAARRVFCEAYKLGMYGPRYQWFVIGYYTANWWQRPESTLDCTVEQLYEAADGYLTVTWGMNGREDIPTVSGKTPGEFREMIADIVGHGISVDGQDPAANANDAMWALGLGLHEIYKSNFTKRLESYVYGDEVWAEVMKKYIGRVHFYGVSGPVSFSTEGDRIGLFLVEQNRDGKEEVIATYKSGDHINWLLSLNDIWKRNGGEPPYDSDITQTIELLQSISSTVFTVMCTVAGCGIVMSLCFLIFNVCKRKHRQIKMSSPNLNNIIASGLLLAYVSVVLDGVDYSRTTLTGLQNVCRARAWTLSIAFTLAFGGMFTKMWRVYSIVIHNKTKRKVIKDHHLVAIVFILLVIDVSILIPREIVDPFVVEQQRVSVAQTDEDIAAYRRYQLLYVVCTSKNSVIWLMTLIIYKAFLMLFGAFLAWQTRNINVPALNDSYYVGLSIYNVVLCSVVAAPLSLLGGNLNVTYALVTGFELFCTTSTLSMLFFPKIRAVYSKSNAVHTETTGTGRILGTGNKKTITDTDTTNTPGNNPTNSNHGNGTDVELQAEDMIDNHDINEHSKSDL
ncbi:gamma-aminobutyric acid type B receptor subunit 1-like [Amphiura filiformis]|uniref:gamma-aminobutyric acid type B receptor subunit 1-like n=1 Tax=Amphiura filiformis TaxID=82378 RepID=UPI003B20BD54